MLLRLVLGLLLLGLTPSGGAQPENLSAEAAPELRLADLHGQLQRLDALRGRTVLVGFWASWCRPCVEEMPALEALRVRFADRPFTLLAVNAGDTPAVAAAFLARHGLGLDVLLDGAGDATRVWGVEVLPSAFLIDARGRIHARYPGPYDWTGREAIETIERLLDQAVPTPP